MHSTIYTYIHTYIYTNLYLYFHTYVHTNSVWPAVQGEAADVCDDPRAAGGHRTQQGHRALLAGGGRGEAALAVSQRSQTRFQQRFRPVQWRQVSSHTVVISLLHCKLIRFTAASWQVPAGEDSTQPSAWRLQHSAVLEDGRGGYGSQRGGIQESAGHLSGVPLITRARSSHTPTNTHIFLPLSLYLDPVSIMCPALLERDRSISTGIARILWSALRRDWRSTTTRCPDRAITTRPLWKETFWESRTIYCYRITIINFWVADGSF